MALKEKTHSRKNMPHSSIINLLIEYLIIREALGKVANIRMRDLKMIHKNVLFSRI